MRYICENTMIRLVNSSAVVGQVITISGGVVAVQKATGGVCYLPAKTISFQKEVK